MAVGLALLAGVLFGSSDFFGGRASRETTLVSVLATSHLVGLVLVGSLAPLIAEKFSSMDLLTGMLAGALELVGLAFLYRGLARGPMVIAAPIAAVCNAALPVIWGVMFGERLGDLQVMGIVLGLISIMLVSGVSTGGGHLPVRLLFESVLAGVGFAGSYIVISGTDPASAPWPVVGARIMSVAGVFLVVFASNRSHRPTFGSLRLVISVGVLNSMANVALLAALNRGLLSLVSVLSSLYPATTVFLARLILRERITSRQVVGLTGALATIVLVVVG
jgi:drug/metabolite transporter (DMT)-like permease|tara:strand:- start:3512 stop:4342 length:831 start_codon:yes stop_codon:yes gene_type:complete